jgi:hypothetical protein
VLGVELHIPYLEQRQVREADPKGHKTHPMDLCDRGLGIRRKQVLGASKMELLRRELV